MKINAVFLSNKKMKVLRPLSDAEKRHYIIVSILSLAAISGVIINVLEKDKLDGRLSEIFNNYTDLILKNNKPEIFSGLIMEYLPYFLLMLLFSTSALGEFLIYIISFFKIAGLSACVTYIYSVYELKGIEFCLLVFLPGKLIMIFSILLLISCCNSVIKLIRNKSEDKSDPVSIVLRFLFIFMLLLIALSVDFFMLSLFSELFLF